MPCGTETVNSVYSKVTKGLSKVIILVSVIFKEIKLSKTLLLNSTVSSISF